MNPETSSPIQYPIGAQPVVTSNISNSSFDINGFTKGIHNRMDPSVIPQDAGSDGINWLTLDGRISLTRGMQVFGNESTTAGGVIRNFTGYTTTGTPVYFRQTLTSFQYLNGSTWTNTNITNLSSTDRFTWTPYVNLYQNSLFITGPTGIYKIYIGNPANVYSYTTPTAGSVLHFGYMTILDGRSYMWNVAKPNIDTTAIYLSYVDQSFTQGTTTNTLLGTGNGATTTFTGNLSASGASQAQNITIRKSVGNVTISIASPGIISLTAHGFNVNDAVMFTTTGALPTGLTPGTTYYVGNANFTANSFAVSATPNGSEINTSGAQSGTHTVFYANLNNATVNLDGTIIGTGITGTVNYSLGTYSITFATAPATGILIRSDYSVVQDTSEGILDFAVSATAFTGRIYRADIGGDAIQTLVQGLDGNIFVIKLYNTYIYVPDPVADNGTITLYRRDLGTQGLNSCVPTIAGIYVMNTANVTYPTLTLLQKNPFGSNVVSLSQSLQFDFTNYDYGLLEMLAWDRYIIASCRTTTSINYNDRILLMDMNRNTIDILEIENNFIYKDETNIFLCSPFSDNVYKLFNGFTIQNDIISNYWITKQENYNSNGLKKMKRFFIKGRISPSQKLQVYIGTDNQNFVLLGTILGSQSYVDLSNTGTVGYSGVGAEDIGGGGGTETVFTYLTQFKTKIPKYQLRFLKFVATGIGYVDISQYSDQRIERSEARIPKHYRVHSNVSKDGSSTNVFPFPNT